MITVELSDRDADLFKSFMENYHRFSILLENGVFDIKNGSAKIHFDSLGTIKKIDKDFVAYILLTKS